MADALRAGGKAPVSSTSFLQREIGEHAPGLVQDGSCGNGHLEFPGRHPVEGVERHPREQRCGQQEEPERLLRLEQEDAGKERAAERGQRYPVGPDARRRQPSHDRTEKRLEAGLEIVDRGHGGSGA